MIRSHVEKKGTGLVCVHEHPTLLPGVWTLVRLRMPKRCALSGAVLAPGEQVYRPLSHQGGRAQRVGVEAMERAAAPSPAPGGEDA